MNDTIIFYLGYAKLRLVSPEYLSLLLPENIC